ncbi:MAG: DUF4831 family protein [Bacteroidales bacterium]|nr:DUF4831 family protein [Bacteroidales bacterium]
MMKQLFAIACVAACVAVAQAQTPYVYSGEPELVYALPATELVFELEIEKVTEKPGVFYQYSQRYLATSKVVTAESTQYRLKSVRMSTRPVLDPARRFAVSPELLPGLAVTKEGFLAGVNVPVPRQPISERRVERVAAPQPARPEGILPLNQEYMMAGSMAKMAEGAAYQIYAIRESRMNLLSGELEQLPADGESLKQMLQGLDRQERELTELFVGEVRRTTERRQVSFIPDSVENEAILFRLSASRGLVANDDLGGEPYYVVIDHEAIPTPSAAALKAQASKKKSKQAPAEIALYTVVPANAIVEISDGVTTLLKQQTTLSQLGVLIPYSAALFTGADVTMEVDAATGRLIRIQQTVVPKR